MNTSSTLGTALLRGLYLAIGSGALTGLYVYQATDAPKDAIVAGLIAALVSLGFRGGVEGLSDASRDKAGKVLPGDVGGTRKA